MAKNSFFIFLILRFTSVRGESPELCKDRFFICNEAKFYCGISWTPVAKVCPRICGLCDTNDDPALTSVEVPEECALSGALKGGIPDIVLTDDSYGITGTTRSSLTQRTWSSSRGGYSLGTYSHTENGVSYYTNGDIARCAKPRETKITWKCGHRHTRVVSSKEPVPCEYEFEVEIDCCKDLTRKLICIDVSMTKA
jgi:hypothetical protein